MSKYVAESIKQLVAGCFGHVGLRQLRTKHTNIQTLSGCNVALGSADGTDGDSCASTST